MAGSVNPAFTSQFGVYGLLSPTFGLGPLLPPAGPRRAG